jgi:hypothetical protein
MGHFSVEILGIPGSALSGNQQPRRQREPGLPRRPRDRRLGRLPAGRTLHAPGADASRTLFPACRAAGTTIICGGPFNSGILVGRDLWNYAKAPADVVAKARALEAGGRRVLDPARGGGAPVPARQRHRDLGHSGGQGRGRAEADPRMVLPSDPGGVLGLLDVEGPDRRRGAGSGDLTSIERGLECLELRPR